MVISAEQKEKIQATLREIVEKGGKSVGHDEIGFEPSWVEVAKVEGRTVTLEKRGRKKTVSIGSAVWLHCPETRESRVIAVDTSGGEVKISIDEARKIFPDTEELKRAIGRSRRRVVITEKP